MNTKIEVLCKCGEWISEDASAYCSGCVEKLELQILESVKDALIDLLNELAEYWEAESPEAIYEAIKYKLSVT